jgi:hypothetical protein
MANLVRRSATTVTVHGTHDADQFTFDASSGRRIAINGIAYEVDGASSIAFDGAGGADHAEFIGSEFTDATQLRPGKAVLRGNGYTVTAVKIDSSRFDGGGGKDVAKIYGNLRTKDTILAGGEEPGAAPSRTTLTGEGTSLTATAEQIYVYGRGGNDTAYLYGSAGDDRVLPYWKWTWMSGPGYFREIRGVKTTYAYGGDGFDTAGFRDSDFDDVFQGRPGSARMFYAPGQYKEAIGFEQIRAFSYFGKDKANLWDSTGSDSLEALPRKVSMTRSNGTRAMAEGFQTVNVFSHIRDGDRAVLVDTLVDQATYDLPEGVLLEDLAQMLWLNQIEKVELHVRPMGNTIAQIDKIDRVFAYWE